jgi:hypothetical protein
MRLRHVVFGFVLGFIVAAGTWAYAQTFGMQPVTPTVISGNDIGFRMEGRRGTAAVGRLVVRVDGQWVDAVEAMGPKQLTTR